MYVVFCFFFQAEDGIRDLVRSRGLGDVYKRQRLDIVRLHRFREEIVHARSENLFAGLGKHVGGELSLIHI